MGKALVIKGADFAENAIPEVVPPTPTVNWFYGLTSADLVNAGNCGPIYFNQYTILKDQNGTYLQGKTISKVKVWVRDMNKATCSISIGYLPSGWTAQTDFVTLKTVNKEDLNMTLTVSTEADVENGLNVIDLDATIPAGALFGIQVTNCYIMVTTGGNSGTVLADWTRMSSNGGNYINWTMGIDFALAD